MKKYFRYFSCFIILIAITIIDADGQAKKAVVRRAKVKAKQKDENIIVSPQFKTQEEYTKWFYEDSLKSAIADSINRIKDSVNEEVESKKAEEEFSRIYRENWYPKDSLSYIDDIANQIISENESINIDKAISLITKRFNSPIQKARAIFFWIASTIEYDYYSFSNDLVIPIADMRLDAIRTFTEKKGVCQNYSNLYNYMCTRAGVECKTITGWGKNFPFCITGGAGENINHAWNCVNTNKGWILLDVTWAKIDTSKHKVDNYWFNTTPGEFIYNHFPEDSLFQFLRSKITKLQFENYPIVSPFLFKSKIDFEVPEIGRFILTGNKFSITKPESEKDYSIAYSVIPFKGTSWKPYLENMQEQPLECTSTADRKNKVVRYEAVIPSKGVWWLSVYINKTVKTKYNYMNLVSFPAAIIFKVTYP